MRTLKEYNKERIKCYKEWTESPVAKVLCDDCAEKGKEVEMVYQNPDRINLSWPPTSWVVCPKCGKRGLKTY